MCSGAQRGAAMPNLVIGRGEGGEGKPQAARLTFRSQIHRRFMKPPGEPTASVLPSPETTADVPAL